MTAINHWLSVAYGLGLDGDKTNEVRALVIRESVAARDEVLRLTQHLAYLSFGSGGDCQLAGFTSEGRCIEPAVAIRWEDGFTDEVCEEHAERARARGVLVVYPHRANGTLSPACKCGHQPQSHRSDPGPVTVTACNAPSCKGCGGYQP